MELLTLSTQDTNPTTSTKSSEETATEINTIINEKYYHSTSIGRFLSVLSLSNKDLINIMNIVGNHIANKNKNDIRTIMTILKEKNPFFAKAIELCIECASDDIKNVTPNTLAIINDPLKKQPNTILNQIPQDIKTWVMNIAKQNIDYYYTIELNTAHTILAFALSPDHAIVSSENNNIKIWSLNNQSVNNISTKYPVQRIEISPNGQYFFIIEAKKKGDRYKFYSSERIVSSPDTISFTLPTIKNYTTIFAQYIKDHFINVYQQKNPDGQFQCELWNTQNKTLIASVNLEHYVGYNATKSKKSGPHGTYYANHPYNTRHYETLSVIKAQCPDYYLCHKAVKNASPKTLHNIKSTNIYNTLTDIEKERILGAIRKKLELTDAKNKPLLISYTEKHPMHKYI
jgi:hypothetical protein